MDGVVAEEIIAEFNEKYRKSARGGDCQLVRQLRYIDLTDIQLALILVTLEEVCPYCYDNDFECTCGDEDG